MDSASGGGRKVFLIDEIGKMELFSQSFIRSVRETLDSAPCTILGTIPVPKGKPLGLVEEVRSRTDVKVFIVSTNMNTLFGWGWRAVGGGCIWVSLRLTVATGQCLQSIYLFLVGQSRLLTNAEVLCPALSFSYCRINSKSCVTDSTTKGVLKCQNDLARKSQLRILSCKTLSSVVAVIISSQVMERSERFQSTYQLQSNV